MVGAGGGGRGLHNNQSDKSDRFLCHGYMIGLYDPLLKIGKFRLPMYQRKYVCFSDNIKTKMMRVGGNHSDSNTDGSFIVANSN